MEVVRNGEDIAKRGGTPLVVADGKRALGTIYLKDIVKGGIKERFGELRLQVHLLGAWHLP